MCSDDAGDAGGWRAQRPLPGGGRVELGRELARGLELVARDDEDPLLARDGAVAARELPLVEGALDADGALELEGAGRDTVGRDETVGRDDTVGRDPAPPEVPAGRL
jgi:hypothetical protein